VGHLSETGHLGEHHDDERDRASCCEQEGRAHRMAVPKQSDPRRCVNTSRGSDPIDLG